MSSSSLKRFKPLLFLLFSTLLIHIEWVQAACPQGNSCDASGGSQTPCQPGYFAAANQYTCQACPVGNKCPGTSQSAPTPCANGQYQNNTGQSDCLACPAGHMCPLKTVQPFICPLGYYAATSQTSCTVCPAGSFCPLNASAATACPNGTFSLQGASQCTICPLGYKCTSLTTVPTVCGDTQFTAIEGQQSCTQCPAGQECLDRTLVPTSCQFGEYATANSGICKTCIQNGKECPDLKTANTRNCPANSYYDWWDSTPPMCKACQPGSICTSTFTKIPCPKGHYKSGDACTPCSAGKFCPDFDGSEIECPIGYYQDNTGATSCKQIPPGKNSADKINLTDCQAGQYFSGLGECQDCQKGFKCPQPKFRMIPCLPGEYQDQKKQTTCLQCPAGSICSSTQLAPVVVASDGLYFAPARSISKIKCPVGWKCSNQAVQTPLCQWGQYPKSHGVCQACPAGKSCIMILNESPKDCADGTYSPVGTMQCIPCPPGKTCVKQTGVMTDCLKGQYTFESQISCVWGRTLYFTPVTISSARAPCPPGSYQDGTGRHTCRPCPANKKCTAYSNGPTLSTPNTTPVTCPAGQFSLAGDGFCLPNPAGSGHASGVFQICAPGQYTSANLEQCQDCIKGHYCPDPSLMPQICPPGTYQDQTGQYTCKVCPAGKYCLYGAQAVNDCPAGSECPVSWLPPKKCRSGYYSEANAQKCLKCPDKKKCEGSGSTTPLSDCPANMYCNTPFYGALPQYRLCPAGTKSTAGQAAFASDCTDCQAGKYCEFTLTRTEVDCPAGYYCPQRTQYATQYPCPEGTYNTDVGKSSVSDCVQCPQGKYCRAGSIINTHPCPYGAKCVAGANNEISQIWCQEGTYSDQKDGQIACTTCIAGHYCPKGSMKAFPCPAGTFRSGTGGKDINDCSPCEEGYACRIPGSTTGQQQACANGHYCPIGTQSPYQFPCPYGTWSNGVTNLKSISQCDPCPKGYACPLGTHTVNDAYQCPQGHYCPDGTHSPYSHKCPAGTYNTLRGKEKLQDCVDCPPGYFCPAGSISPTDLCPPGYYCEIKTKYQFQFPCRQGKYQPMIGQTSSAACISCPPGYYCEEGSEYPVACPRGHHCPADSELRQVAQTNVGSPAFNSRSGGQVVAAGKYAQRRSGVQTVCPEGMYSHTGADLCLTCPSGFDCPSNDSALEKVIQTHQCAAGDFCYEGSGDTPGKCPVGNYCEAGVFLPKWCKAGTYAKVTGKNARGDCDTTSQGYWTPPGTAYDVRYPCQPGHYCEAGSIQPDHKRCPAGTYRATTGATAQGDCVTCTLGHYCPLGTYQPIPCGDGHYCNATGLSQPIDCAPGTYSPDDKRQVQCEQCPIGKACTNYGLSKPDFQCAPGFLCTIGSSQTSDAGQACTSGGYCELGTVQKESCKAGTFNPDSGKEFLLDCKDCTAGKYCDGSNSSSETGDCDPGYYCTGGATTPTQEVALPGHFTLAGATAQTQCGASEYQDLFAQDSCKNCQAGFYCNTKANDGTARNVCQSGYYCPQSSQSPKKCPVGTFSYQKGLKAESQCLPCLPGRYCQFEATNQPSEMQPCSAGYYCKEKAIIGTPENGTGADQGKYGTCTKGHYCPVGTAEPIPCPAGRFAKVGGLKAESECTLCTAGKYCETQGLQQPTGDCEAGYFCPPGSKSQRQSPCPAGKKCPTGSPASISCLAGTYQKNSRQADCLTCPDGYDCSTNQITPQDCPKGNYCQGGNVIKCAEKLVNPSLFASTSANCAPCPPGRICNSQGLQQATLKCPAGFYCSPVGDKTAGDKTGQCAAGTYCPQQSAVPIKCPGGHYCTGGATFTKCTKGYFCTGSATKPNPTSAGEGGGQCPPGYYCPQGSDSPIACPPGTFNPSKLSTELADCLACPAGKYCQDAAATTFTGNCSTGYYCPNENRSVPNPVARICSANKKCDGSAAQTSCAANSQYQPNRGQSTCLQCPTGFLCSDSGFTNCNDNSLKYCDSNYSIQTCLSGSYSPSVNAASINQCVKISAGFRFTTSGSTVTYTECTQGNYCQQGSASATTCPEGSYCPTGSAVPIKCKAGYYCSGNGLHTPTNKCDAGYYCIEGAITAKPTDGTTGNQCPKGHYCIAGSSSPTACPIGTYRSLTGGQKQQDCTACDVGRYCDALGLESPKILCYEGYFCDASSTSPNPRQHSCTPGHKCPVGSSEQTDCEKGEYQPLPLQGNCLACPERYYCPSKGLAQATICPKGKYCPEGTGDTQYDCLAGTYNDRFGLKSQNQCQQCPTGYACQSAGMTAIADSNKCTQGYYCVGGSNTKKQYDCPQGYFCPVGTYNPIPCPIGTYSDTTNLISASACTSCPAGYYCSLKAASRNQVESDTYKCAAGYLCTGGSTTPTPVSSGGKQCSAGKYCQRGATSQVDCPKGTYNPYVGQASCTTCPAGRLCATEGLQSFADCPIGKYCIAGAQKATDCPAGTYSPRTNLSSASECLQCDPGKYCLGGQNSPTGDCDAGFSCPRGSATRNPSTTFSFSPLTNGPCPAGHYCLAGNKLPVQCPLGTINSTPGKTTETGNTGCASCPAGFYCDQLGLTGATKKCSPGFICLSGSQHPKPTDGTKGKPCSKGKYCPEGTTTQLDCPGGYYEPREGSSSCQKCPAGYQCAVGAIKPEKCPLKEYCEAGVQRGSKCPAGTYGKNPGLEAPSQCTPCPTGKYCQDGEVKGDCLPGYFCHSGAGSPNPGNMLCPSGHYCKVGTLAPKACDNNKVRKEPGATQQSDCVPCEKGFYCLQGDPSPHECPKGYYCDGDNNDSDPVDPKQCPLNTFNANVKAESLTNCLDCPAGTICSDKAIASLDLYYCPKGKYCQKFTDKTVIPTATDCPGGTYNPQRGKGAQSECLDCPAGSFCPGASIYPRKCDSGTYCLAKSSTATPCPVGYYCPYGSPDKIQCPAGYYCQSVGTDLYKKCPSGTYCEAGSTSPITCPKGTYGAQNPLNISQAAQCISCQQGTYMQTQGQIQCKPCTAGYTCLGGTNTSKPTDQVLHKGKICPKGFYCPQGSWQPKACPQGTYQPDEAKTSMEDCKPCDQNSFTNQDGQSECKSCGNNAFNLGQSNNTCSCKGKNRDFQPQKSHCMCSIGFQAVGSDDLGNSKGDCQPKVYQLCTNGQVYNDQRQCVDQNDCSSQCGDIGGSIIYNVGLCQCSVVSDPDSVCNASCRNSKTKYSLDLQGNLVATHSNGQTTKVSTSTLKTSQARLVGDTQCATQSCRVVAVGFGGGGFTGNYDMDSSISNYMDSQPRSLNQQNDKTFNFGTSERSLQTQSQIINPIICIKEKETLVFQVNVDTTGSGQHEYPVYDRDSLLNTKTSFDYSAFTQLKAQIQAGNPVKVFAYTFQNAGTYVFYNSLNRSKKLVVSIKTLAVACPSGDAYLMPTTYQNLLSVGVSSKQDIVYQPNWAMILGILAAIVLLILILILIITYYRRKQWKIKLPSTIPYRLAQQKEQFEQISANTHTLFRDRRGDDEDAQDDDHTSALSSGASEQEQRKAEEERKKQRGERYAIQQNKIDEMLNKADVLSMEFLGSDDRDQDMHKIIQMRLKELLDKLRRIREGDDDEDDFNKADDKSSIGRNQNQQRPGSEKQSSQQMNPREEARLKQEQRMQKQQDRQVNKMDSEKQAFMEEHLRDGDQRQRKFLDLLGRSDLTDQERDILLRDFNNNADRVNGLLEEEEKKQQEDLKRKLDERKQRRLKLRAKIQDLENLKDEKSKQLRQALEDLNDETAAKMRAVNEELQAEENEFLNAAERRMDKQRKDKRLEFQALLGKNKKSDDMEMLVNDYEEDSHALERKLQIEFDSQKKNLKQMLEERRERKRLQFENQRKEKQKALLKSKDDQVQDIQDEIEKLKRVAQNESLNQKIENLVDAKMRQEDVILDKIKEDNEKELDDLEKKHQAQLDHVDTETIMTDQQDDQDRQKELIQLDQEEEQLAVETKKRDDIKRQIDECDNDLIKAQLMKQLQEQQNALMMRLQKEQSQQKSDLGSKLAQRRLKKLQRKKELQAHQDKQKRELLEKQLKDEEKVKKDLGDKDLIQILHDIKMNIEEDARPYAIQKAIDEKHARELSQLLMRQFKQKAQELQDHMIRLMEQKAAQIKILNEMCDSKRKQLESQRGSMDQNQFEKRMQDLKLEAQEKKDDIEDRYLDLQANTENEITRNLLDKHTKELMNLKMKQNDETKNIIENYIPQGMARDIFSDNLDQLNQELERFKRELEDRRQKQLSQLAERERILRQQREQYKQKMNKMDQFGQFLGQHQMFAGQRQKAKRFDMGAGKIEEEQKRLIDGYKKMNQQVEKVISEEQLRQKELFEEKIRQKKEAREQFRQKRKQELEEAKLKQEEQERKQREVQQNKKDSQFEKVLVKYEIGAKIYDKVKGAFKLQDENKKNKLARFKDMKKKVGGLDGGIVDPLLRSQTPSANLLKVPGANDRLGDNLLSVPSTMNQPKQAITTDDEILAKLMLKINNIENRLAKFKVTANKN